MYPKQLTDHFENPRNTGELAPPALRVEAVNPACGDVLCLFVRWEGGRVAESSYLVRGCVASIAAGSVLTEMIRGKTAVELRATRASGIDTALGGLPAESGHAATLCIDALRALLAVAVE